MTATITLSSTDQAEWIAAMPQLAGNGHRVQVEGATVTLDDDALAVLSGLDEDNDGHFDGRLWIGGTAYAPHGRSLDVHTFQVRWNSSPASERSFETYTVGEALARLEIVQTSTVAYIGEYPELVQVWSLADDEDGFIEVVERLTAAEFRARHTRAQA